MKPTFSQFFNLSNIKTGWTAVKWMASMPFNLKAGSEDNLCMSREHSTWEEEREDILERANWLVKKIVVSPEKLINEAPSVIGLEYQCEWAIYCCSMLAHALANIAHIYPDKAAPVPGLIAKLVEIVNTPAIRQYDTMQWREDAMETLDGPKSHMTYLSILAWIITNYKMAGGDDRYDALLDRLCDTLHRRMLESPYALNLLSFPGKPIWMPDMFVTIVALKNYTRLYDPSPSQSGGQREAAARQYAATINTWLQNARTKWTHNQTGLLGGMLPGQGRMRSITMRGSCTGLNCSYLSLVDPDFAREQHELMKRHFTKEATIFSTKVKGLKEFLRKSPDFSLKGGDAGLIIKGISAGGTAFALGSATLLEDWDFRYELLRTAEIGGGTVKEKGMRHYRLGEFALVGEATALAMRTNIRR